MSSMGELTFFLGLQVKQKDDEIFISQDKYVADILKKFDFTTVKTASTPMEPNKALIKDAKTEDVDVHLYISMIGSLMYLTTSRSDIIFAIYACARFQVTPKTSHLHAVKRIFRYLKGQPKLGLWYPRDSPFDLEAFFIVIMLELALTENLQQEVINFLAKGLAKQYDWIGCDDTKVLRITLGYNGFKLFFWRYLKLEDSDGISTLPNTEIFEQLALMGNMRKASKGYTGVDIPLFLTMLVQGPILHGEGSTVPFESHHTPLGALTTSQPPLSSPSRIPTRHETEVSQPSSPTHTHVADEAASIGVDVRHGGAATTVTGVDAGHGSAKINKTPSMPHDSPLPRVHTLESNEGRMQQNELIDLITKLTDRVLALETDLQQTKKVYSTAFTKLIMKVKKLEKIVKSTKARRRAKIVVSDDEDVAEDTFKQGRKIDAIDQDPDISLVQHDAEVQGRHEQEIEFETEDISTAETLVYIRRSASKDKDIQAKIEVDEEHTSRGKGKYSEAEKAILLLDLINQRKRHFAQQKAEERRNKPLTQAQQRTYMSNNVKHMRSHTLKTIPKIADESSKGVAEEELKQESSKRQKTGESSKPKEKEDDELTQEDLQQMMIVPVEEVYVEALQGRMLGIRGFYNLMLLVQVSTAEYKSFYCWLKKLLLVKIGENSTKY
nr:putative ribonuclease H-like domain-containing protein [Tanacetum cinerariifolium]